MIREMDYVLLAMLASNLMDLDSVLRVKLKLVILTVKLLMLMEYVLNVLKELSSTYLAFVFLLILHVRHMMKEMVAVLHVILVLSYQWIGNV